MAVLVIMLLTSLCAGRTTFDAMRRDWGYLCADMLAAIVFASVLHTVCMNARLTTGETLAAFILCGVAGFCGGRMFAAHCAAGATPTPRTHDTNSEATS